jgi:4-amino-4-deoxy-L-arabinose transferase-like glycosyltransferase
VATANLTFSLLVVTLLGAAVRLSPLTASGYPLNDGGLFVRMSQDLLGNGFSIPATSTYNGEAIPFAYPPLGLFLTAAVVRLTGMSAVDVLRVLPGLISVACILAFYLLAAELLRSRWRGVIASAAFALLPRSYLWLVVGGGSRDR